MKVTIREMTDADRPILDGIKADEEVLKQLYLPSNADSWVPESRKSLKEAYPFTVLADGEVAGTIALEYPSPSRDGYQVNLEVGRQFWDEGIPAEAMRQILRFGFDDLGIDVIHGATHSDDPAPAWAFLDAGFRKVGICKEHVLKEGDYIDIVQWRLTRRGPVRCSGRAASAAVHIRETREADTVAFDRLCLVPGCPSTGSRQWVLSFLSRAWVPESRKSFKDEYPFTILADGEIAGEIGLQYPSICRSTYGVGYAVARRLWNKGICTEALKQLVRFAFDELKIHKLASDHSSDNPASGRVLEKAGFEKEEKLVPPERRERGLAYNIPWRLINPAPEGHGLDGDQGTG